MLESRRRPDGRAFDQIRHITIETGVLPRTHGSALFTRGETQALVTVTLGTKDDEQRIELLEPGEASKRFMLHYNFPPFSVGEVGFMRGPGRREIGHGALAERALTAHDPGRQTSSPTPSAWSATFWNRTVPARMATVCGASLALMDAGVPLAGARGRHRHGPGEGRRQVRHPHRHRRRRRPLRRHGLQGRRHARRHHRAADGHQGAERDHRHHEGGAGAGAPRPAVHPRQDVRGAAASRAPAISQYAPRIYTITIPTGQDPRRHRTRRQGDPRHHRADRREDRRRGRRHGARRLGRRGFGQQGAADHRRHHRHRRGGQDLSGQGGPAGGFRRVRRDLPRHRRPAAHQRDRREPHPRRARRAEGRRPDPGEGPGASKATRSSSAARPCCASSARS